MEFVHKPKGEKPPLPENVQRVVEISLAIGSLVRTLDRSDRDSIPVLIRLGKILKLDPGIIVPLEFAPQFLVLVKDGKIVTMEKWEELKRIHVEYLDKSDATSPIPTLEAVKKLAESNPDKIRFMIDFIEKVELGPLLTDKLVEAIRYIEQKHLLKKINNPDA